MSATTKHRQLVIQRTGTGCWAVLGAPEQYGSRDNEQVPFSPPEFATRFSAIGFALRVIDRGEADSHFVR